MFVKSLREVVEIIGLKATLGIVRGRIVLSIVKNWFALRLWGTTLERRDGYDVYDHGGSSAPSTSGLGRSRLMAATSTAIVAAEISILYWEKRMVKMGRL